MAELIPINVIIADRNYRLKIKASDEELVRKTVKLINEKVFEFKNNFAAKDMQDYVSMVLLWFATEQTIPKAQAAEQQTTLAQLANIESLLDKALIP